MANYNIPYGKQEITAEDISVVIDALKADFLTQGPFVSSFERKFAEYVGSKYAVAVSNGTAALHLNALALGVKPGQKVITSPITFAASANCIRYCGGEVVFADIDSDTYLLDIDEVRKILINDTNNDIVGMIPVDFAGRSVDMEAFRKLADEFGCWIIEDACHAPGAFFVNSNEQRIKCGSGAYADLAIFSFHPVKHIAAGEGGMITTNSEDLYNKLLELRTHGITRDSSKFKNPLSTAIGQDVGDHNDYPGWYMEMQSLGFNYRITDFQCALAESQLSRASDNVEKRKKIARKYFEAFKDKKFIRGQSGVSDGHSYHLYVIEVQDRLHLYNYLKEKGVYSQVHYLPVHLMPYYKNLGWKEGDFPKAEKYYKNCLSLPMYPSLKLDEQDFVIECINEYYLNYGN